MQHILGELNNIFSSQIKPGSIKRLGKLKYKYKMYVDSTAILDNSAKS